MKSGYKLRTAAVFYGRTAPEEGTLIGYGAILEAYHLEVPVPFTLSLISTKRRNYSQEGWTLFAASYLPDNTLYAQLVFALKYEGVQLLLLKKLFKKIEDETFIKIITNENPTGQYNRKLWFLYEWLLDTKLDIPDAPVKTSYTPLLDDKQQYTTKGEPSPRHRITNNLPGTREFCPIVFKTDRLKYFRLEKLEKKKNSYISGLRKEVLQRAAAFLLLKDSKASFSIEGESPRSKRAARWGQAIGQAGSKELSQSELERLQQLVIENPRFLKMGYRKEGGFVGEHERLSGEPIPEHISAKADDLENLMQGLLATNIKLQESEIDAVVCAAIIAFGFVFIHPFEDGNGRIHRYLIHHILAKKGFAHAGIIFPVSAAILNQIDVYKNVLETYSKPLLDFIEWEQTSNNNVSVTNDTADYYRYFDATPQAEFLYQCVEETIKTIIPQEVDYLIKYDSFKNYVDDIYEMPDKKVALLVRFLEQNDGKLSKRALEKEFDQLESEEINDLEENYSDIFKQ